MFADTTFKPRPNIFYVLEEARRREMAGATVTGGVAGFGKHQHLHTARIFELSSDLPMVLTIIDTAEAIASLLPVVQQMIAGGIVIQDTVKVVHHAPITILQT
ncbi:MAG: DUF190 domain-containing protein [Nostoc sp.]|uniref:DUF190 domain-containing protein n=1 Tax=Nostoc sp. TaxID=1180 RepID=UPI002FEFDBB9